MGIFRPTLDHSKRNGKHLQTTEVSDGHNLIHQLIDTKHAHRPRTSWAKFCPDITQIKIHSMRNCLPNELLGFTFQGSHKWNRLGLTNGNIQTQSSTNPEKKCEESMVHGGQVIAKMGTAADIAGYFCIPDVC